MKYEVASRSQHAKTGRSGFHGPDTYVVVLEIPDGVRVPRCLNRRVLFNRGIMMTHFGEGYSNHSGPRSSLGRAIASAQEHVAKKRRETE